MATVARVRERGQQGRGEGRGGERGRVEVMGSRGKERGRETLG